MLNLSYDGVFFVKRWLLEGKKILICGLANKRSIAAGIAKSMTEQGAQLAFSYQSERLKRNVESIANDLGHDILIGMWDSI